MRILVCLLLALTGTASAEQLGAWTYTAPEGYALQPAATTDRMVYVKAIEPTFCLLAVYQPRVAQADLQADLDREWKSVILAAWTPSEIAAYPAKESLGKLSVHAAGAVLDDAKAKMKFYGQLMVVRGNGAVGSVLVVSNDTTTIANCFPRAKLLIDSIAVAASPALPAIAGLWATSSASTNPQTGLSSGSIKTQYDIRTDGTYVFHQETWRGHFTKPEWYIVHETGTYTATADKLTLTPKTATGVVRDEKGAVIKTAKPKAEKTTYAWRMHYFEGLKDNQLVLTPPRPTARDGEFANNPNFKSSYLYSLLYKPEWQFAPQ